MFEGLFPGMGGGQELPSGDPVLPSHLSGAHAADRAAAAISGEQGAAWFGGRLEQRVETILSGVLASVASAAIAQMRAQGVAAPSTVQQTPPKPTTTSPAAPAAPSAPSSGVAEGVATDPNAPKSYHPLDAFREGRERGASMTMGSAARSVLAPIAKSLSSGGPTWVRGQTSSGAEGWVRYRDDMPPADRYTPTPADVIDEVPDDSVRAHYMGPAIRAGIGARALATGVAAGDGIVGSLGAAATKVAGPIGLAYGAAQLGGGFLVKQNESAATYRSAFGEDGTGMFAAQDRLAEWKAGLSGFGTIGGDRARAQFEQASSLGLRGARRDDATDFASDMYMRFGMDTSDSMRIVQQSIEQGNVSLQQFSAAITDVSRAAVDAGRSSKEAIDDFVAAQNAVAQNITPGGASVVAAKTITSVADNLSTPLKDALGGAKGITGLLTQRNVMALAAQSGQDAQAAWFNIQNPATADQQVRDSLSQLGDQIVSLMAQSMGMTPDALKSAIAEKTGGKTVSESQQYQIFLELAGGQEQAAGILTMVLQTVTQFYGIPITQTHLLDLLFQAAQGAFNAPAAKPETPKVSTSSSPYGTNDAQPGSNMGYSKQELPQSYSYAGQRYGVAPSAGYSSQESKILSNLGYGGGYGGYAASGADSDALKAYVNYVARTGQGNTYAEEALTRSNMGKIEQAAGVGSAEDVKYRINVGGKYQDMSMSQIISSGNLSALTGDTGIVSSTNPKNAPQEIRFVLDLTPDAKRVVSQKDGPSDEQRTGTPSSGYVAPNNYPSYGH